jgi:uncharacterized sodium:solute symporter family permease YidK
VCDNRINSPLFILLLGWVFVPYYLGTGVFTMPEFLEKRYNRYCRYAAAWAALTQALWETP